MSGFLDSSMIRVALDALAGDRELIAPVTRVAGEAPRLEALPAEGDVLLGPRKPLLPLKSLFLPQVEDLFHFRGRGPDAAVTPVVALDRDRVVVGALGCDVASLQLLDRVFLAEPPDEAYCERRERTTIVALACVGEGPECFCASAGVDPLRPDGADALLTPAGDGYLLQALTDKGRKITEELGDLLREPTADEQARSASLQSLSRDDVSLAQLPGGWAGAWDSPVWEEVAELCLGCGVCTVVCPTCHCFDVQDERRGEGGTRFRTWDSGMFPAFTTMAGGENPRKQRAARFRQRFLHKLAYFHDRYDIAGCVGCGRCGVGCSGSICIEEIAARLRETEGTP